MPDCLKCDSPMLEGIKSLTFISDAQTIEIQKESSYYCEQCQELITKQEQELEEDDIQYTYLPSRQIVQKLYQKILDREPDTGGLRHYMEQLDLGKISPTELKQVLINSDEYKQKCIFKEESNTLEISEEVDELIIRC